MKRISLSSLFVVVYFAINAQVLPPQNEIKLTDKELGLKYLKKSKDAKLGGWILVGTGLLLFASGAGVKANDIFNPDSGGEVLAVIGGALVLASIPCFISGAKNKRRAKVLLKNENVIIPRIYRRLEFFPSLTVAFKL